MVDLKNMQRAIHKWSLHNFGDQPSHRPLLGIAEELGELSHAHLKGEQGIRHSTTDVMAKKIDAVADLAIYLLDYCAREGIDFEHALATTWWEVGRRDWKKYPQNGLTE